MASLLLQELVGDDDFDDYDDEDYYDEECEDLYSPYAEPPPVAPVIIEEEKQEPVEIPKIEVEMTFCDICHVDIPKSTMDAHINSKKHRGAILDIKVRTNQEKAEREAAERLRRGMEYFAAVFTPNIMEKVCASLPADNLLKLRLVCRKWKDYLDMPDTWMRQYELHSGSELHSMSSCYDNSEFPLTNLGFRFVIENEQAMQEFLEKPHFNTTDVRFYMKGISCCPETLWKAVCQKFADIPSQVVYLDFWARDNAEGYATRRFTSAFTLEVFKALAQNNNLDALESRVSRYFPVDFNPLSVLEGNKKLRSLKLTETWFHSCITENTETGAVEFEEKENRQRFTFHSTSVLSLEITPAHSSTSFGDLRALYLIQALKGNTKLEELCLSNLLIRGGKKFRHELETFIEESKFLKKLDLSRNGALKKLDWNVLALNNSLQTLDLSHTNLGSLSTALNMKKNDNLQTLNLSGSLLTVKARDIRNLPSSLTSLDISNCGTLARDAIADIFSDLATTLPGLTYLNLSKNCFQNIHALGEFIANTQSIRTLMLFEGSSCRNGVLDELVYNGFMKNSSIVECDHMKANAKYLHHSYVQTISEYLLRNAGRNLGRRTKGIR